VSLPGVGHSVPDRDKVGEMIMSGVRAHHPDRIVWAQSDDVLTHSYWIEAPQPSSSGWVEASVRDNTITLKLEHQDEVALWLDTPLVNWALPVTVEVNGVRRDGIKLFTQAGNLLCQPRAAWRPPARGTGTDRSPIATLIACRELADRRSRKPIPSGMIAGQRGLHAAPVWPRPR